MSRRIAVDGWRLAVGTLTAIPVRPPRQVDGATARWSVVLAPWAVLPLGAVVFAVASLAWAGWVSPWVTGVLAVGALALGSRGMHLDGLSDTADGLASGFDAERSLQVMRSGAAGPAGVATTVVVLGAQAMAMVGLSTSWRGAVLAGVLVCVSRGALLLCCLSGVPGGRTGGLGQTFSGVVPVGLAVLLGAVLLAVVSGTALWAGMPWWRGLIAVAVAVVTVGILVRHTVRRLGGVTGDVYGASIEVALTSLLVTLS